MKQYLALLQKVMDEGVDKKDRTGVGTKSIFGYQMRFNLAEGFPLVTTKKVIVRNIISELLWFLQGGHNVKALHEQGNPIWDAWADDKGELGPVYGQQWTNWGGFQHPENLGYGFVQDSSYFQDGINQIHNVVEEIKRNPDSRRLVVSAWNVADLPYMRLPPCHVLFQFYVLEGKLSCQLYQRSGDLFLGVPFNIASYALLTQMVARVTGLQLGEFIHTLGDAHIYLNHQEQVRLQLSREPRDLPQMELNPDVTDIFKFKTTDFTLSGYEPHGFIKAPIAV